MKQWTKKSFLTLLKKNGYFFARTGKGTHAIYSNSSGQHITVSKSINSCLARRIIKEHNLNLTLFIYGYRYPY